MDATVALEETSSPVLRCNDIKHVGESRGGGVGGAGVDIQGKNISIFLMTLCSCKPASKGQNHKSSVFIRSLRS